MFTTSATTPQIPGRVVEGDLPQRPSTFGETIGAAMDAERIETNWYNQMRQRRVDVYQDLWSLVVDEIGVEQASAHFDRGATGLDPRAIAERIGMGDEWRPVDPTITGNLFESSARYRQGLFELLADIEGDFPRSMDDVQQSVVRELRAEWDDAQMTLNMGQSGRGLAEFLGRSAIAASDPASIAMMPFGGGSGGVLRTLARGAAMGAAGEAAVIPRMLQTAEELDLPEPQILAQIAMGAAFGGIIDGSATAVARGFSYLRDRSGHEAATSPTELSEPERAEILTLPPEAMIRSDADRPIAPLDEGDQNPAEEGIDAVEHLTEPTDLWGEGTRRYWDWVHGGGGRVERETRIDAFFEANDTMARAEDWWQSRSQFDRRGTMDGLFVLGDARGEQTALSRLDFSDIPETQRQQIAIYLESRQMLGVPPTIAALQGRQIDGDIDFSQSDVHNILGTRPEPSSTNRSALDEIDEEIARIGADNPRLDRRFHVVESIIDRGGIAWRQSDGSMSVVAQELSARGFSTRSFPGLFRRGGATDLDNIPGGEIFEEGNVPLRTDQNGYLDRDDLIDAIAQELDGTPFYRTQAERDAAGDIARLEDSMEFLERELDRAMVEGRELGEPLAIDDAYFPTPDQDGADPLARADRAQSEVDRVSDELELGLTPEQRTVAAGLLADFGGPVQNAIDRAIIDLLEEANAPAIRAQQAIAASSQGRTVTIGEPIDAAAPEAAGSTRSAADRGNGEGAAQGEVEYERSTTAQSVLYDDPTTPQATARMDAHQAELSDALDEFADIEVDIDGQKVSARQLLNEMQRDQDHIAALEACGFNRGAS